ncbi:peptidoglycan-binding protein [Microseira sp. BLCC-F43]|jgi:peptidoglycan hydrolase-like protein with peptidoglycan-binding domain|uniref:peptidoglycan-binding domain-containing protein n=1 Tax=Microseira sp. BLCC-F43 TaxID=3153602 RepID=UPI0035BA407E
MPTLRRNDTGLAVKILQKVLNCYKYGLKVDVIFGATTEAAVKDFQKKYKLTVDGIVGSKTYNALADN